MGFTILRLQVEALRDLFYGVSSSSSMDDIKFYHNQIDKTFDAIFDEINRLKGGSDDGQSKKDAS